MSELRKRPDLLVHEREPLNLETPRAVLGAASLTPADAFFVRDHGPVPDAGPDWRLEVGGLVDAPLSLGLDELRDGRFARREVTATLQCAGNRRAALLAVADIPGEAPWGPGATGTAVWGGVALADVLRAAGPQAPAGHVAAVGADRAPEARPAAAVRRLRPAAQGARRRGAARLGDERGAAARGARRPAAPRGPGVDRGPQREVAAADRAARPALRRLVPGRGLPAARSRPGARARRRASPSARWP